MGWDSASFPLVYDRYLPPVRNFPLDLEVHNIYLELLAETGLLGLLGFLVFMYAGFRDACRQLGSTDWLHHSVAFAVSAGILGLLVEGLFDHYIFWSQQVGFLFWLWLGVLMASTHIQTRRVDAHA